MVAVSRPRWRWLSPGLLLLAALTVTAVGVRGSDTSSATFTTTSETFVRGYVDRTSDWLALYSQGTDPGDPPLTDYATRRLSDPLVLAAEGEGEELTVDLGGYPDYKQDFPLTRVFTLVTPAAFPDPDIDEVTVRASLLPDPGGAQPLRSPTIRDLNGVGNQATVTLGTGQTRQFNVTVRSKRNLVVGRTYYPHVVITVTFTGGPANYYYSYDIPMAFTDAGQ